MDAELQAEQAHVDAAYQRLDQLRTETQSLLQSVLDQGRGGTHQFREERDVIVRTSLARLDQLDIGEQALCFGRIDRLGTDRGLEVFHIGRLGVSGAGQEPLVVDWRAPVAEPFYRATGRDPMGLVLRRHLAAQGRRVVGLEDEWFAVPGGAGAPPGAADGTVEGGGAAATATSRTVAGPGGDAGLASASGLDGEAAGDADGLALGGPGALLAALDLARTGSMRDIVATIQSEQDEIIRSPLAGVLVVQGGPGTGKTAVALHRAAYLLYTHRFPLERQGVLVIGPNPLFLRYIEQVLPSLGESGVTLSTVAGLVRPLAPRGEDDPELARLKGEARMATVIARAVRGRQRPLRRPVDVPFGAVTLELSTEISAAIVNAVRRRPGTHNARRRLVEQLVVRHLVEEYARRTAGRRGRGSGRGGPRSSADQEPAGPRGWFAETAAFGGSGTGLEVRRTGGRSAGSGLPGAPGPGGPGGPGDVGELPGAPGPGGPGGPGDVGELPGAGGPGAALDGSVTGGQGAGAGSDGAGVAELGRALLAVPALAGALDRMWPRLSAEELVHDLLGAPPLLAQAGRGLLSPAEQRRLVRRRATSLDEIPWTLADLALVDEAGVWLGPRRPRRRSAGASAATAAAGTSSSGEIRTYGHIVVDEAQDLSPMQLRMVARRSLSGSITVVGDIAQATGPWAPVSWDEVVAHLPDQRPARYAELTVSYRTPAEVVALSAPVLEAAAPGMVAPTAVRRTGVTPVVVPVTDPAALAGTVVEVARQLMAEVAPGTVAVLAPTSLVAELAVGLDLAGVSATDPRRDGLGAPLSLLPVDLANGLEFDAVVVVEPGTVVREAAQGVRALYVALTRPTRRLAMVHARPLPSVLAPAAARVL